MARLSTLPRLEYGGSFGSRKGDPVTADNAPVWLMENPATPPAASLLEYRNEAEGFAAMPKPPGAAGPFGSNVRAPVLVSTLNTKTAELLVA